LPYPFVEPEVASVVLLDDGACPFGPFIFEDVEPVAVSEPVELDDAATLDVDPEVVSVVVDCDAVVVSEVVVSVVASGVAVAAVVADALGVAVAAAVAVGVAVDVVDAAVDVHPVISSNTLSAAAAFHLLLSIFVSSFMQLQDIGER